MAQRAWFLAAVMALAAGCGPTAPSTPLERGELLMKQTQYGEAIVALTEAINQDPRDAAAYLARGRAYQCRDDAGDVDAAIADFTSAIGFLPKDPEAYYSRAIAYRRLGNEEKALSDDAMARKLDSRIAEEYEHLPTKTEIETPLPESAAAAPAVQPEPKAEDEEESAWAIRRRREAAAEAKRQKEEDEALDPFDTAASRDRRKQSTERGRDSAASAARSRAASRDAEKELEEMRERELRDRMTRPAEKSTLPAEDPFRTGGALTGRPIRGGTLPPPRAAMPGSPLVPGTSGALPRQAGGAIYPTPTMNPYSSPFPQRPPAPTGIVPQRAPGTQGALEAQPRPTVGLPNPVGLNNVPGTDR